MLSKMLKEMLELKAADDKYYLTDRHITSLANNDVCFFFDRRTKTTKTGYVIARLGRQQPYKPTLPNEVDYSKVFATNRSDLERLVIQFPFGVTKPNGQVGYDSEFHIVSRKVVLGDFRYDREDIIKRATDVLRYLHKDCSIKDSDDQSHESLISFDIRSREYLIYPQSLYSHLTRMLVFRKVAVVDAIYLIAAHEVGHYEDVVLMNEAKLFGDRIDSINKRKHLMKDRKLTLDELYLLKADIMAYNKDDQRFEENAWRIGRKFIPDNLLTEYDFWARSLTNDLTVKHLHDVNYCITSGHYKKTAKNL